MKHSRMRNGVPIRQRSEIIIVVSCLFWGSIVSAQTQIKKSIIVLSPQLTELFFQLGADSHIAATVTPNHYPQAAQKLPTVGAGFLPNFEAIFALSPESIYGDDSTSGTPAIRAAKMHFDNVVSLPIQSLSELFKASHHILERFAPAESKDIIQRWENCFSELRASTQQSSFSFILVAWANPLIIAGHQSFLSDLFKHLGGKNEAPESISQGYPTVGLEWGKTRKPDHIFYLKSPYSQVRESEDLAKIWPDTKFLPLDEELFSRASLTPLNHLSVLSTAIGLELPEVCEQ